jgi:secreted trypsin-like serine protease
MKTYTSVLLHFLLPALLAQSAGAITFGEVDVDNQFPNVGAIVLIRPPKHRPDLTTPRSICSATLIHPRVLLTAGHCTEDILFHIDAGNITLDDVCISFGADAFDETTWLKIEAVVSHPDFAFSPVNDQHDAGLVVLKDAVDLPLATLAYAGFLEDLKGAGVLVDRGNFASFLAVGYGASVDFAPPQTIPGDGLRRYVSTRFIALQNAWLVMNQNPAIEDGNGGTGFGDSGGPRYWIAPDGSLVLVAITSRGDPKLVALDQAYRIDTAGVLDFIDFVVAMIE